MLRYANARLIAAGDPADEASWESIWLDESKFDELERRQLSVLMTARGVPAERVFSMKCSDFEYGEPEVPLSKCDVVDDAGVARYSLWVVAADSGILFRAGSTDVVTEIIQDGVAIKDKTLAKELDEAMKAHAAENPDSNLGMVPSLGWG